MLILDLWGISFHAVVVFGLGKNLLFNSILGLCDLLFCIQNEVVKLQEQKMILSLMCLDATLTAVDDNGDLQIYIICILQNCELSLPHSFILILNVQCNP